MAVEGQNKDLPDPAKEREQLNTAESSRNLLESIAPQGTKVQAQENAALAQTQGNDVLTQAQSNDALAQVPTPDVLAQAPAGYDRALAQAEATSPVVNDKLEIGYNDPNFDHYLSRSDYKTLKINGLPEGVKLKEWVDDKGYFFWFENGSDNKAKHYMPNNLEKIEIQATVDKRGLQEKPQVRSAVDLRVSANEGYLAKTAKANIDKMPEGTAAEKAVKDNAKKWAEQNTGFRSRQNGSHPLNALNRAVSLASGMQSLDTLEPLVREAADANPHNPYLRLQLADIYLGQSLKPVVDKLSPLPTFAEVLTMAQNGKLDSNESQKLEEIIREAAQGLDNPQTLAKIKAAENEAKKATECARTYGDIRLPSLYINSPLHPYGLANGNPSAYWMGAADQAYLAQAQYALLHKAVTSGALKFFLKNVELPPNLPPR